MDYKKVIEDFASGKIDREKWVVVMDNDGGYWRKKCPRRTAIRTAMRTS